MFEGEELQCVDRREDVDVGEAWEEEVGEVDWYCGGLDGLRSV